MNQSKKVLKDIQYYFLYFLSKWKLIVLIGMLGGVLGLCYSIFSKPKYEATLSFALEDEQGGLSGALGIASQLGLFSLGAGSVFNGDNIIELMESRNLVEKTLLSQLQVNNKKITFAEYYIEFNEWRDKWDDDDELKNMHYLPNANRANFSLLQDSILGEIYKKIIKHDLSVFKTDRKSSIINIKFKSRNEIFSKYFTETLVDEVTEFYIETKSKKARMNLNIIEKQVDSVRRELMMAITDVAEANDNVFNLNSALNINRVPSAKKQVDVQANSAILTELVKNLEIARLELRKETPIIQIIDKPIFPIEDIKLRKIFGLLIGGFLGGFLILFYLYIKLIFEEVDYSDN